MRAGEPDERVSLPMPLDLTAVFVNEGSRLPFEYALDLSDVDFFGHTPIRQPVKISAAFTNRAGVVTMKGTARLRYEAPCDRCAADAAAELEVPLEHVLVTAAEDGEADDMVLCPDMRLDAKELLRSDVLLALPLRHLCSEDCKGLCPRCGKNLNEGECGCKPPPDRVILKEVLNMAVPKRKTSKARRDKRRSSVWKLEAPTLMKCPRCGEYKRPHRLCPACGYYKGRDVLKKDA